ncbi:MAG: 6-carboxytetrahydropterin synthase [Deltaproteobacteria bacterium]|nr:MAG: 6-carboxytetrahydropterin synthase [Deltaproteobacteria bacterium]
MAPLPYARLPCGIPLNRPLIWFSVENIVRLIYKELGKKLNSDMVSVSKVKVSETPGAGAFYWEE